MSDLADVQDVVDRWRPLSPDEEQIASVLISDASDIIRVRWPDVDYRLQVGSLSSSTTVRIVANMVRRAMLNRDNEGVTQGTEVTGPFTRSETYSNPNNNLYLSAEEVKALDPLGYGPRAKVGWLA